MALAKQIIPGTEPGSSLSYGGQPPGSPDYPNLITSGYERRAAGIGRAYVDEYNQMLTNQYNNAYNYWLWQQQMEYNSPASQMARYLEAGLNPHYQTVDSGNAQGTPESKAQVRGNVRQNQLNSISTAIGVASSIASMMASGVSSLAKFASVPSSVRMYRKLLTGVLNNKLQGQSLSNALKELNLESTGVLMGNYPGAMAPNIMDSLWYGSKQAGYEGSVLQNAIRGKEMTLLDLKAELSRYDLNNLRPAQLDVLRARLPFMAAQLNYILAGTGLRLKETSWKDPKEGVGLVAKILDAFIPF